VTVAARAIQDGNKSARGPHVRLNRAACVSRRIRTLGANELSAGEDDDEDDGSLL
jgi:hypothetical protein